MAYGIIGYGQPGTIFSTTAVGTSTNLPSGTIWGDCQSQELLDEGNGYFVFSTFKDVKTLPGLPTLNGTYTLASSTDSAVNIAFNSTAAVEVYTSTLAPVAANGNTKLWFETNVLFGQSTAQTAFIGLGISTALNVATLFPTSTTLLSTTSLIGFFMHADQPSNMDAVYQKTGNSTVTVLASTLTANANNPNPGNLNSPNPIFPGAPGGFSGGNWIKLGVRVDKNNVTYYVNGAQVAKKALDTTFDSSSSYGGLIALATSTTGTSNLQVSWFRVAGKIAGQI